MLDALIRSFWFEKVNNLGGQYMQKQNEENKIFEFIQQFQNGNFEQKKIFVIISYLLQIGAFLLLE